METRMAERYFGRLTAPASTRRKVLRVAVGLFLGTWWSTALCSGYRAIWQVSQVEVSASDAVLRPGSTVRARIATSGRTYARLDVALVQGGRSETLASRYVPASRHSKTDPRGQRASLIIVLTPRVLSRFRPGPATLRAVGLGSSQFLHVPPPRIRDVPVRIAEARASALPR
jgi:hypothetical protein